MKTLFEISKTQNRDQTIKVKILVALKNIISSSENEIFQRIVEILQMIQRFVIDQDESIISKAKECDEMLKAKILQYSIDKTSELGELLKDSLEAIQEHFENDNLNVKNWCLGWLGFLLNVDMNFHQQYGKIVISLIQFLNESKNVEIAQMARRLLEQSLSKFAGSQLFRDINFSINFLNKLLGLYVSMMKKETENAYEKCEIILNWCILIGGQLKELFKNGSLEDKSVNSSVKQILNSENSKEIEDVFHNSILMITSYSKHKKNTIKEKLGHLNEIVLSIFQSINQLVDVNQVNKSSQYQKILQFSLAEMSSSDDQTIDFLIKWNEQIFLAIKEKYIEHIEHMIKILDNKNEGVNNNVIKFISSIIHQLNNPVLTKKIFCYFLENSKNDMNMNGFLKFLKILFNQFPDLPLFMSLINEVSLLKDKIVFPKVVHSFHIFVVFEENFVFVRNLLKAIKTDASSLAEKQYFKEILQFWCHDNISLFSLSIMAGRYELAHKIISQLAMKNVTEKQLLQLTMVVKMLELPYSSQIRIDLLDYEKFFNKESFFG